MDSVGERLKFWRKSNGFRLKEIAEAANVSQGALSDAENNKKLISSQTLISLKRIYDINITWILTGEENAINLIDKLTENEKDMLNIFSKIPEREQLKFIGRLEQIAEEYNNLKKGELSSSKTG